MAPVTPVTSPRPWVRAGPRIGRVRFTAELHHSRPALNETWEEIVEVPFRPVSTKTKLGSGTGAPLGS